MAPPPTPANAIVDDATHRRYATPTPTTSSEVDGPRRHDRRLRRGVEAGDLEAAKATYAAARAPWERIEPIAELFPDLDSAIDFREEDFDGGVDDPEFMGFHRIEKVLWADGTADGLAPLATEPGANVAELKTRIDALDIDPRVMARGAGELIDEVAQSKMTGEEDRYSKTDLYVIDANVDGSAKIVEQLRPILTELDADYLASSMRPARRSTRSSRKYADGDGFKRFDAISAEDLKLMQARLAELSELLAELPGRSASRPDRDPPMAPTHAPNLAPPAFLRAAGPARSAPRRSSAASAAWRSPQRDRRRRRPGPIRAGPGYVPFDGDHQAGHRRRRPGPQNAAIFVALDVVVGSRPELATTLRELTDADPPAHRRLAPRTPATRSSRHPRAASSARRSARPT